MGMTEAGGRRLSFFPNDFEYHSEDEKFEEEDGFGENFNGEVNMMVDLRHFDGQAPLVLSRRESGNDHSTATSHCAEQRSDATKASRKSHGIKKSRKES